MVLPRLLHDPAPSDAQDRSGAVRAGRQSLQHRAGAVGGAGAAGDPALGRSADCGFRQRPAARMAQFPRRMRVAGGDGAALQAATPVADRAGADRAPLRERRWRAGAECELYRDEALCRHSAGARAAAGAAAAVRDRGCCGTAGFARPGVLPPGPDRLSRPGESSRTAAATITNSGSSTGSSASAPSRARTIRASPRSAASCAAPGSTSCRRSSTCCAAR